MWIKSHRQCGYKPNSRHYYMAAIFLIFITTTFTSFHLILFESLNLLGRISGGQKILIGGMTALISHNDFRNPAVITNSCNVFFGKKNPQINEMKIRRDWEIKQAAFEYLHLISGSQVNWTIKQPSNCTSWISYQNIKGPRIVEEQLDENDWSYLLLVNETAFYSFVVGDCVNHVIPNQEFRALLTRFDFISQMQTCNNTICSNKRYIGIVARNEGNSCSFIIMDSLLFKSTSIIICVIFGIVLFVVIIFLPLTLPFITCGRIFWKKNWLFKSCSQSSSFSEVNNEDEVYQIEVEKRNLKNKTQFQRIIEENEICTTCIPHFLIQLLILSNEQEANNTEILSSNTDDEH